MKYIIGTGFFNNKGELMQEFHRMWYRNTLRYSTPSGIYTIASAGSVPPKETAECGKWIGVSGDLGHVGLLVSGAKKNEFSGWTAAMLTLALTAYNDEADFIFKEQDCLAFGNWPEQMYKELGSRSVIFGSCKLMGAAQSLFLVKKEYIPRFVVLMLSNGDERTPANLGEKKFARFEALYPKDFCRFSFGYDRDRPFNMKDSVFYAQQLSGAELNALIDAKLVDGPKFPDSFNISRHDAMY